MLDRVKTFFTKIKYDIQQDTRLDETNVKGAAVENRPKKAVNLQVFKTQFAKLFNLESHAYH